MNKYRVLKPYPKQITNSGRLVTLQKGRDIYLKTEPQVLRLIRMGFIKPIVELPKKKEKLNKKKPLLKQETKPQAEVQSEDESKEDQKRKNKSEYLKKK